MTGSGRWMQNGPAFWTSNDRRRVIWIERGDFCDGEIDWATCKIVNRKQVTTVGSFNALNKPLLWWGHLVFLWGNFDKEKPIVRLDLASGEMTELETFRTLNILQNPQSVTTNVSPGACRIVYPTASLVYSYDVRTGKSSMFRNKYEILASERPGQDLLYAQNAVWVSDEMVYSFDPFGWIARGPAKLADGSVAAAEDSRVRGSGELHKAGRDGAGDAPGGHRGNRGGRCKGAGQARTGKRFLLDVTTGERTPLPYDDRAMGVWVDPMLYIYVQTTGGLSGVGTWAYDRSTNKTRG